MVTLLLCYSCILFDSVSDLHYPGFFLMQVRVAYKRLSILFSSGLIHLLSRFSFFLRIFHLSLVAIV